MNFCTHCGAQLEDGAVLCTKCGCPTDAYNQNNPVGAPAQTPKKTRVYGPLSIVGFVFAFLIPLVGLICSVIAFKNAQAESNIPCKNFTKAAIVISAILLGINVALNIVYGVLNSLEIPVNYYWNIWRLFF